MYSGDNILISLHPQHVSSIIAGKKTVELRRKPVRIAKGTRVWIYTTLPRGAVEIVAIVDGVTAASPSQLWKKFHSECGIGKTEFDRYFHGLDIGYAISFTSFVKLPEILNLRRIREQLVSFHPPQFFKRLEAGSDELLLFSSILA